MDNNYEIETAKIKLSSKLNKKAPPIVATFSCGQLNDNSKIEFECFKPKDDENLGKSNSKKILMAQTRFLTYEGSSMDSSEKFASQYFIGVRNKRTGKMKLFDSSFFHLRPKINNASEATVSPSPSTDNYWEGRNKLTAAFGGKVSKRVLNAQLKYAVDTVESSNIATLPTSETPPMPQTEPIPNYLPSLNREAGSVDEVFDINEIIFPEEDCALQGQAENLSAILTSDPESAKVGFCKFAQCFLKGESNLQKLKYIIYYNYMVIFQNLNYNDIRKKDPAPLIPEPFKQSLMDKFTIVSKYKSGRDVRVLPSEQRDKLVAYIFVLALLISNYCVNINQIIQDFKRVRPEQLNLIAQTLGCHIKKAKIGDQLVKLAELSLPLSEVPSKYTKRKF